MVAATRNEKPAPFPHEDALDPHALGIRENRTPLILENISVHKKTLHLLQPFETSFGRFDTLVKIFPAVTFRTPSGDSVRGVGECPALPAPWYDGECDKSVAVALHYIVSSLMEKKEPVTDCASFINRYRWVVGNNMAKVGVEGAYWDAVARARDIPVHELWGGEAAKVEAGTSIGLEATPEAVVRKVDRAVLEMQVARVKIKIKPGRDLAFIEAVRKRYPTLRLQVDANAAYNLFNPEHMDRLKSLDQYSLMMIEQPGRNDDILDHSRQLACLETPVCLDESILHAGHARQAVECWQRYSCLSKLVINIKPPRVGGFLEAIRIAKLCHDRGVSTWCGGMLESALGKAANIHFSTRKEVNLPGDHVGQGPYFKEDVAAPMPYRKGSIQVPTGPGWGTGDLNL